MSNDATREAWNSIIKELDYFEAKPHKLCGHNRMDFEQLILQFGKACQHEITDLLVDLNTKNPQKDSII